MPLELQDADGNKVVLPVDKVEEITDLKIKVEQLEKDVKPDWRTARQTMDSQAQTIADLTAKLKGKEATPPETTPPASTGVSAAEVEAKAEAKAQEVFDKNRAEDLEVNRKKMVKQMAGGDTNREQAIEAKYQELSGGKKLTNAEEIASKLADAKYLVEKPRHTESRPFNGMDNGAPSGGPNRIATGDKAKAVDNLEKMGYRFKGSKEKLING